MGFGGWIDIFLALIAFITLAIGTYLERGTFRNLSIDKKWVITTGLIIFCLTIAKTNNDEKEKSEQQVKSLRDSITAANTNRRNVDSLLKQIKITIDKQITLQNSTQLLLDTLRKVSGLQSHLNKLSIENVNLSKNNNLKTEEAINQITGGESYCEIEFWSDIYRPDPGISLLVHVIGKHPLSNLEICIVESSELIKKTESISPNELRSEYIFSKEGLNLSIEQPFLLTRMRFPSKGNRWYNIRFKSNNRIWYQRVALKMLYDGVDWEEYYQVYKRDSLYRDVILHQGNTYDLPHYGKKKLITDKKVLVADEARRANNVKHIIWQNAHIDWNCNQYMIVSPRKAIIPFPYKSLW